jgi:hypothetical protein
MGPGTWSEEGFKDYHKADGDYVQKQCKNTTSEQEKEIENAIMAEPQAGALECASTIVSVLNNSGVFSTISPTMWPGNLSSRFGNATINNGK